MRKVISIITVAVLTGAAVAADGTSVASSTPPIPIVAPAPAVNLITWYGMAMFRFREEIVTDKLTNGTSHDSSTFTNQLGYKIGAKIKANDQVTLQFELGNDWAATDEADGIPGNYANKRNPYTPWFSLAFVQWDPGYMHIAAGIIPVRETALMDLLGVSILYNKIYAKASQLQWGTLTNFSQTGLRIGAPVLKDGFKLGVDAMTAIVEQRPAMPGLDTMKYNSSAIEFLIEAPMSCGAFTAVPQLFVIPDRSFDKKTQKGDAEVGAGADIGYKLNDGVTFRAGVAYAQNSNDNSYRAGDSVAVNPFDATKGNKPDTAFERSGINATLGSSVMAGPGKLDVDLNLSTDKNAKNTSIDDIYSFIDLKYGWMLNQNFIIMPRLRFFIAMPKVAYDSKLTTRPELIFTGSF
jgi:hypothetical protein